MAKKIAVAMIGSRMHYAIPKILYENDLLANFYTDITCYNSLVKSIEKIGILNSNLSFQKLLTRNPEIPKDKIKEFTFLGLQYFYKKRRSFTIDEEYKTYTEVAKRFSKNVNNNQWWNKSEAIYLFNTAALEMAIKGKQEQRTVILEQCIIPAKINFNILNNELEKYGHWVIDNKGYSNNSTKEYEDREEQEWNYADVILAPSEIVKMNLEMCNVPSKKIHLIPYGVKQINLDKIKLKKPKSKNLNILCVGYVELRKGVQYLYEVAKICKSDNFRYVGQVNNLNDKAISEISKHIELTGHVNKDQLRQQYEWADVFILLTLAEGSATVIYEAISFGLPVITTLEAGSMIQHGVTGFIVDKYDKEQISQTIEFIRNQTREFEIISGNINNISALSSYDSYKERIIRSLKEYV